MALRCAERFLTGWLLAVALVGGAGHAWLLAGRAVPDWLAPLGLALAVVVALRRRGPAPSAPAPTLRWLPWAVGVLLLALAATLAWGSLATPSRHWDGAVAWDLKAAALAAAPTLEQPFFRDPLVYCHSRDYPLLQPLLVALADRWGVPGRLLFPLSFLAVAAAVLAAARRAGASARDTLLLTAAGALVPMLLNPTSGAFDSGYGDGPLCAMLAATAWGLTSRSFAVVALGAFVVTLQKPEGVPYAAALLAACWLGANTAMLRAAALGGGSGAILSLSLQHDLRHFGQGPAWWPYGAGLAAGLVCVCGLDAWLRRRQATTRARLLVAAGLVALALLLLTQVGDREGTLAAHLAEPGRALQRLDRVPQVLLGIATWALLRGPFGLCYVLAAAVALPRPRPTGTPAATLGLWLLLAVPLWCAPFLLSPIDDLDHHLRSTLPRLLLQWTGVAWLWIAVRWPAVRGAGPAAATD